MYPNAVYRDNSETGKTKGRLTCWHQQNTHRRTRPNNEHWV